MLSSKLQRFKQIKNNWNFRCPICGDSEKNERKARGWLLNKNGNIYYFCHNCGIKLSFKNFLKRLDFSLYNDYLLELIAENKETQPDTKVEDSKFVTDTNFDLKLKKVSQLQPNHYCKQYVLDRRIPSEFHYKLFFTPKFKDWTNSLIPNKFENLDKDEARLIFPFLDKNKKFFGFQGRSFGNSFNKYITIMLDENFPKIFGLDTANFDKPLYVVEGPIDSLFIENGVASCGGSLLLDEFNSAKDIIIYDNEPRSKITKSKLQKAINKGWKVCVWPSHLAYKDINDMILAGMTRHEVKNLIDQNTYSGLSANLKLIEWDKT